jgi:hypothetical protein
VWLIVLGLSENSHDSFWRINLGHSGDLIKITIKAGNDYNTQQTTSKGDERVMEIEVA